MVSHPPRLPALRSILYSIEVNGDADGHGGQGTIVPPTAQAPSLSPASEMQPAS
ncbi:MAG TPA: hypothetical protein V6D18_04060 [Thermosynechococcaceae cyanobacterium]